MTTDSDWPAVLDHTSEDGRRIANAARALIRELDPDVVEVLWPHQGTAGFGVGPKKMSEHYAYLALHPRSVNLGFYRGASLPDPAGLLGGPGANMRHMRLNSVSDLERPEVRQLLRDARAERLTALGRG